MYVIRVTGKKSINSAYEVSSHIVKDHVLIMYTEQSIVNIPLSNIAYFTEEHTKVTPYSPPPSYTPAPPSYPEPYTHTNTCSKCNLVLTDVMGYVCSRPDCPTFLHVTC